MKTNTISKYIMRLTALFLVCIFFILPTASAAQKDSITFEPYVKGVEFTQNDKRYLEILSKRELVFAYTTDVMLLKKSDGTYTGVLEPVRKLLCDDLGLNVRFVKMTWNDGYTGMQNTDIDFFGLLVKSSERTKAYIITDEIISSEIEVVTRLSHPIGSLVNMEGKKIGLLNDSALPGILTTYIRSNSDIQYYPSAKAQLDALESGEIDVVVSSQHIQLDVLRRDSICHEFYVNNLPVSQGITTNNEELRPLVDIINRCIQSSYGDGMRKEMYSLKYDAITKSMQDFYKDEINYIKENYDQINIITSPVLYPLSYKYKGEYKGILFDINDIFKDLTGINVSPIAIEDTEGYYAGKRLLEQGTIQGYATTYADGELESSFVNSMPLATDHLSLYTLADTVDTDYKSLDLGTTPSAMKLVDWISTVGTEPHMYFSRNALISAVKSGELEAAFLSDMAFDYEYTVKESFELHRNANFNVVTPLYMLYSLKNKDFNTVYDVAINIHRVLNPQALSDMAKKSDDFKYEYMSVRAKWQKSATMFFAAIIILTILLAVIIAFAWYQLRRYNLYDKQIKMLLQTQTNIDLIWGNIKTDEISSKGEFPIFRRENIIPKSVNTLRELEVFTDIDFRSFFSNIMDNIKENNLPYAIEEKEFASHNGDIFYTRFYMYRLNENQFMACCLDITASKTREKDLSRIASTDSLSGLLTRRAMNDLLAEKQKEVKLNNGFSYVVLFDIDDFKLVNDRYGHDVGDAVLVKVANTIKSADGFWKTTSRWGGEEFMALFNAKDDNAALSAIKKILLTIEQEGINMYGKTITISASAGISKLSAGREYNDVIIESDNALYKAKKNGKNMAVFFGK